MDRIERIELRCSPEEKADIERAAAFDGVSMSEFIREATLAAAAERRPKRRKLKK